MSITAKITSLTSPDKITIGKDVYHILHPEIKIKFKEVENDLVSWKYTDRRTGDL
jgi:adenylate cyclase